MASYVVIFWAEAALSQENATGWRRMGALGGGVSSSSIGGTTRSPSSELGEKERLRVCHVN